MTDNVQGAAVPTSAVEQALSAAAPVPQPAATVRDLMAAGSPYWDAQHPNHEDYKARVSAAIAAQVQGGPAAQPAGLPTASPAPVSPAPAPANLADFTYEVPPQFQGVKLDQTAVEQFRKDAAGLGLTPAQYRAVMNAALEHSARMADVGVELAGANTTAEVAKLWNVPAAQVASDPRMQAVLQLARQHVSDDVLLQSPGFRDPQVVHLLAKIAAARR